MVSIDEIAPSIVSFYTNPVDKMFRIQFQNWGSSKRNLSVYSSEGKKLLSLAAVTENMVLDFSNFSAGVNLISILDEYGKQEILKVIKN